MSCTSEQFLQKDPSYTRIFFIRNHSTESFFLIWFFEFLQCRIDNSKSCSDILYQTPALNLVSRTQGSILMGRINKKQGKKFCHRSSLYKNLMERYFALKISFLVFQRPKNSVLKVSASSSLQFLINGFLIIKIRVFHLRGSEFDSDLKHSDKKYIYLTIDILHMIYCK